MAHMEMYGILVRRVVQRIGASGLKSREEWSSHGKHANWVWCLKSWDRVLGQATPEISKS